MHESFVAALLVHILFFFLFFLLYICCHIVSFFLYLRKAKICYFHQIYETWVLLFIVIVSKFYIPQNFFLNYCLSNSLFESCLKFSLSKWWFGVVLFFIVHSHSWNVVFNNEPISHVSFVDLTATVFALLGQRQLH